MAVLTRPMRERGCRFQITRGLKGLAIFLVALIVLGVGYQTIATATDKQAYAPRGQLYTVYGYPMHLVCMGEGSPTVILQAGAGAESLWWYWVQNQVATQTRVCAYDRPGHGWSETTSVPRDAISLAGEWRALLELAVIQPPYVVVGHSFGAPWARVFASLFPDEVAGLVLVDSTFLIPAEFADQRAFDQWKTSNDILQALVWGTYRLGLVRLAAPGDFQRSGYPAELIGELTALRSPNHVFDADYAEQVAAAWDFRKASANAENFGDLPMMVLWAGNSVTAADFFAAQREATAAYSDNSVTRMIAGADHGSILGTEQYAQQVSDAIFDVIAAAQSGEPLASE